jgi:hypothetical protein
VSSINFVCKNKIYQILGEKMKKNIAKGLLLLMVCTTLVSCGTIVSGPSWLSVETSPSNVKIRIEGLQNGEKFTKITPLRVQLNKNSDYKLVVETPNYKSEEVIIRRSIDGWFWGNILIGGILGMGIDYLSGNMWNHNKHLVNINLETLSSAPDSIKLNVPVLVSYPDSSYETKFLPITFHRKS